MCGTIATFASNRGPKTSSIANGQFPLNRPRHQPPAADLRPTIAAKSNPPHTKINLSFQALNPKPCEKQEYLEVEAVPLLLLLLTPDEEWKGSEARHSCTNSAEKRDMAKGEDGERNGNRKPREEIKKWAWMEGRWSRGRQVVVSERPLSLLA